MQLTPQVISEFKKIISNPKDYNFQFPAFDEIFEKSDTPIAKHLAYNKYISIIKNRNLTKMIFYIIMDEVFEVKKCEDGDLGYCVKFKIN